MSKYYEGIFTTGEFAKICSTTKETLYHYDELGILKPVMIKDNGYRYYSIHQRFEFDLIKVLQEASTSLKDIQTFLDNKNEELFITMLNQKYQDLENEKQKFADMQRRIKKSIETTTYGMSVDNRIRIEHMDEEHLLCVEVKTKDTDDIQMFGYVSEHLEYCKEHHISEEMPLGGIILNERLIQKDLNLNYYYSILDEPIDDPHYFNKPSGLYVLVVHKGYYNTIEKTYQKIYTYLKEAGYAIVGNAYEYELISHFTTKKNEDYKIQIAIQVEKI